MKSCRPIVARLLGTAIALAVLAPWIAPQAHAGAQKEKEIVSVAAQAPPESKQTTLGLYLTARQAYDRWKAAPDDIIILDVRTPEEFLFVGHPTMAWNIPAFLQSYQWDAQQERFPMSPNPDFLAQVMSIAAPTDTLFVMCRSGGRSARAVNRLAEAGFATVYNIIDGMEGDLIEDPESAYRGQRHKNGWKNTGLPWTYDIDPDRMLIPEAK